jgi:DNA-binding NarL/FixJ family response regulator
MDETITVVLADDHLLIVEGLRSLLSAEKDIRVLATASDGERLLDAVRRFQPDVAITDIRMDYLDGLACLQSIREISPHTRILILTAYSDGQTVQSVLTAGADGLLLKTDPPEQAIKAIRQVVAGQLVFPAAARRWLSPKEKPVNFSERELQVLSLVARGLTNAEVAAQLHVSTNTIKFHLRNIYQQLGVSNRTEASRWYMERDV